LQNISQLLRHINHRNKNQHRRSVWWRHFSTFRKELERLRKEAAFLLESPTTHVERQRKKARSADLARQIDQRIVFWQDIQVPKWERAFSQIVADIRFSSIGLVLLASLAESCRTCGITAKLNHAESKKVMDQFSQKTRTTTSAEDEDLGEAVARETYDSSPG
ncbi:hypothetical protein K470DRAFT_191400, partial [Piedraia hortae CBS 480.64]